MRHAPSVAFALLSALVAAPAGAQGFDSVLSAEIRPGWRIAKDRHMAGLHLKLAPGWKTYWRAPGDAGIPPLFRWSGRGAQDVAVHWPAPIVFHQSGMRSVGYSDDVILPLTVTVSGGVSARLDGEIELGICEDVCIPATVSVSATLPADAARPDPLIAAALASLPLSGAEAGIGAVRCTVSIDDGALGLRTVIDMPGSGPVDTVIETKDPHVWVDDPVGRWQGGALVAETRMIHRDGGAFALDRSGVRITVLMSGTAVDIRGCD